jgi:hypothetical protein
MNLQLALKAEYFRQIKAGTKTEEYRLYNDYWRKRLQGRTYDTLTLTLGYPTKYDDSRRLTLPYRGYTIKTINHQHFGSKAVKVFAIALKKGCE